MEFITEMAGALWAVWKEMWSAIWKVLPRLISLFLWLLSALIILPCMFVAGVIYPHWEKWGESL